MDGIQAYSPASYPQQRPIVATVHHAGGHHGGGSAASLKTTSDYFGAIRRRIWLVALIATPIASVGTLLVLRMPAIYAVTAQITIEPPKTDPAIRNLVGSGEMIVNDTTGAERYVPSTLQLLNSKSFLKSVLTDAALGLPASALAGEDPAGEMVGKIKARVIPQSTTVQISYEGKDPDLITRILDHTLNRFAARADDASRVSSNEAREKAARTLKEYGLELAQLDEALTKLVKESRDISPTGQNIKAADYEVQKAKLAYLENRVLSTEQDLKLRAMNPQQAAPGAAARAQKIAQLEERRIVPQRKLRVALTAARDPSDPSITKARDEILQIDAEIKRLQQADGAGDTSAFEDAGQQMLAQAVENVDVTQKKVDALSAEMRDSMPDYQRYKTMMDDRELKAKAVASLREKLSAFRIVTEAQKKPVEIIDHPDTPTIPVRPNRMIYIAICILFSGGVGLGLVCLLEHIDHSVKVPEHLTAGLALPLFGVVPRMIRSSRNHRGGHLWTSGTPDSIEADAYRNLRASLLGAIDGKGPIVTLLITSAKAGEGKSTTALNLAATCARAGERTLLMDVDLRRPSLNGVFPDQDHDHGLVDVLRGDLPWQRVVVQTDLPNLDFLPTGDTQNVPIEVLGSLELRQLLLSLSQNHYDRVILDGPAVLGLADCRMLGRIVDAAVMVVRSGSQEIRSLQRAKAMLEQSQVYIAGLIFNGLCDDLENWSSYGPNPYLDAPAQITQIRPGEADRGLGGRERAEANSSALMASGSSMD